MKNIKNVWLYLCTTAFMLLPTLARADADDVFEPMNDKTDQLVDAVTTWVGGFAVLMIVVFGAVTMTGNIKKVWGVSIIAGCLIILTAAGIGNFLLTD